MLVGEVQIELGRDVLKGGLGVRRGLGVQSYCNTCAGQERRYSDADANAVHADERGVARSDGLGPVNGRKLAGFLEEIHHREDGGPYEPKLFVQGSLDEYGSAQDLAKVFASLDEPKELKIIEGADHFFEGQLPELAALVSDFIASIR